MVITGKAYVGLKWLSQIFLPAFGLLYLAFSGPSSVVVVSAVLVADLVVGVLLTISQFCFRSVEARGTVDLIETNEKMTYSLTLDGDPAELKDKKRAVFEVVKAKKPVDVELEPNLGR